MDRKKRANDSKQPSALISAHGLEATASLPQRIGETASRLLGQSFKRPSPSAVTGVLASLTTENVKAGSSSSSTDTNESCLAFRQSSQYEQAILDQGESFRSNGKGGKICKTHSQVAFDEFFAGPKEFKPESKFARDGPALSGDRQPGFLLGIAETNLPRVQEWETCKMHDEIQDLADQYNDGAAVVALLADPAFTVDHEHSSIPDLENDNGEGRHYERLQAGKGAAKPGDGLHSSNPLDLMPDFGAPCNSSHASLATQKGIHVEGHVLESRFGDVQPWIDILDMYHDGVWGDMLPLIQRAREELKVANEKETCLHNGPAIQRLKMVLQHLGSFDDR